MDVKALRALISATPLSDVAVCRAELVAVGVVRGLLDAREVQIGARLDQLAETDHALFPQAVVADAGKASLMHAERYALVKPQRTHRHRKSHPDMQSHHHLVHEGGWQLHLAPDRTLTTTLPDQTTMTNGPPRTAAA